MRDYGAEVARYLEEVQSRKMDNLDNILEKINQFNYICVFGAGMTSHTLINLWRQRINKKINFLCDNDRNKWNQVFYGDITCISPEELKQYGNDVAIVIASKYIKEIYMQLKENGHNNIFYRGDYRLGNSKYLKDKRNIDIIKNNVLLLMDMLEDIKSKEVLCGLIKIWFDYNLTGMEYSVICTDDEYFPSDIVKLNRNESFVDGGAYNGDTLLKFLKNSQDSFDNIFSFELDQENYKELKCSIKYLREDVVQKIHIYNLGIFDEEKVVYYQRGNTQGSDSHICDYGQGKGEGKTVRLSDVLKDEPVSFIKMDIEGAELNALFGAEELIKRHIPKLAICVYHKPEHLWEIPFYIKELVPQYKLYLRHHSNLEYGTVCYAIP